MDCLNTSTQQYNKITQEIIDRIKCPCQVFLAKDTIDHVNQAYQEALARGRQEGFIPILVQSDDILAEWLGILDDDSYSKEALISQERKDGAEILKDRYSTYTDDFECDPADEEFDEDVLREMMEEWDEEESIDFFTSPMSYSGKGIEETILFEIPVKNPWEVIAWMPIGGWNDCPEASEMMAVCRYWYEKYGAIPAAFTHDVLEFILDKPVDEEAAWELAKEHFAFCPDRVFQATETGTINEVADCLKKSSIWYFWWD